MSTPQRTGRWRMSRRGFLIGMGLVGGGLAIGVPLGLPAMRLAVADALDSGGGPPTSLPSEPQLWFQISPQGMVTMAMPKVEMGQGIHTALAQIAADELGVGWEQIAVVQAGSTDALADGGGTSASNSVAGLFLPLRKVAATMREMLRSAAATRLGVPATDLELQAGVFSVRGDPGRTVGFGELVQGQGSWEAPDQEAPLKNPADFTLIGQPLPRLDLPDKLRGAAIYGYDARAEGMLYGAVARPPTIGATLRRAAPGSATPPPGLVKVVVEDGFAGAVAESRAAAYQAVGNLELEWDAGELIQQEQIDALVRVTPGGGVVIQRTGDAPAALRAAQPLSAEYRTPMAAHAHLEAQAALVDVRPDRVVAQVSTQASSMVARSIAEALGRNVETVSVTPTYLGGGFGRKLDIEAAVEAARLSAAAGRPVHVGWTRTEDLRYGYVRPPTHHVLKGVLDANGRITAMSHEQASGDVLFSFLPAVAATVLGADFGAWRGARVGYAIANIETRAERIKLPIPTGSWRGLGLLANVFAVESFVDELAHAAGADPLAFRLAHAGDDPQGLRLRRALETVAERADWGAAPPAGHARGVACSTDANTVVAHIAEVSVDGPAIRVHQVWAAVDPGLPINPDGISAQTEGNITMGLSATLLEKITVKDGKIEAGNFDRYPLLTMRDAPAIDVAILRSGDIPYGVGEPPMGPIAAAVANAVFALTGQRLRELPLTLG